ncbi:Prefoldin, subunit 3 [Conidiobolus coronatus NRRL 28638]|uniref:Prefoldin subunit 3 n=1 Tax=Conidiobolus coronatus (strain ATCC 28846 / CBS 209.66 / NRRL 28638) TaxID=796925 RepID=A0A137NQB0_CONC2|nr:Prefoldin, subunit 3 [Conidiobolus coronatus NRRL 28638]|eukprot:KXN64945.1 Prefoldin, subunit 3 [Conidiobolus coronatus NRRL 28638]
MTDIIKNPRGIPSAPFVNQVEEYVHGEDTVQVVLQRFTETVSKYRFMENSVNSRKKSIKEKIPEIKKSLDMLELLKAKQEEEDEEEAKLTVHYELNDTLYAKAAIPKTDKVGIWLGANVMLEYTLDEAEELLSSKLSSAQTTLQQLTEDSEFLKCQITTMEVNIARVYNWDVKQRRTTKTQ